MAQDVDALPWPGVTPLRTKEDGPMSTLSRTKEDRPMSTRPRTKEDQPMSTLPRTKEDGHMSTPLRGNKKHGILTRRGGGFLREVRRRQC